MRDDLAALTPETVAALANLGLVKRALKEIEAGKGPTLAEADGTVVGTFEDGVVAKLPVGVPLKDAPCTCGAAGACRHKVAVALSYKAWVSASAPPLAADAPAPHDLAFHEIRSGQQIFRSGKISGRKELPDLRARHQGFLP